MSDDLITNKENVADKAAEPCPECGEAGPHFIPAQHGFHEFWTCAKFYDPVSKRRFEP